MNRALPLLVCCVAQFLCSAVVSAAQLSGWIEPLPTTPVNLTAEGTRDWIQGGYNGDYTKLNRKVGANLFSSLKVANPLNNGTLIRPMGPTLSWSDGAPDATCAGTTSGVHAQGQGNSISFTVPAGTAPMTIRIYSGAVNGAMQFRAHLSDNSAPDWVNEDWYVPGLEGSIAQRATLCFAAASAGQSLTVTITDILAGSWASVGIHAVTLQDGATAAPPIPLPPVPTGLRATAGNGQVMVQWNQGPFAASYNVYRSTNATVPGTPWRSGILPIPLNLDSRSLMLSTLDTTAANGSTWHYWIAAVNAGGETRAPQAVTATPTAPTSTAITTTRLLKILPMGDSITFGYPVSGGYRTPLLQKLGAGGYQVQMVGRVGANSTGMAEPLHEGWPGQRIEFLRDEVVDRALNTYQPDIILLMIGANHFAWDRKLTQTAVDKAIAAYDELLAKILNLAPTARVIVAPILPIRDSALPAAFNAALKTRITTLAAQGRPVSWCDMSSITVDQLVDGYHPNAQAYAAMGDLWYKGIQAITTPVKEP